jgi:hypothetical protein
MFKSEWKLSNFNLILKIWGVLKHSAREVCTMLTVDVYNIIYVDIHSTIFVDMLYFVV